MKSAIAGTSKHLSPVKIITLNLHIALNTMIGKWDPWYLGWILFPQMWRLSVSIYVEKIIIGFQASVVLPRRHKDTVFKTIPYANMASAPSYSFGICQHHINIIIWDYRHCMEGKLHFLILSMINITSLQWKLCTILLVFAGQLTIASLKWYAMTWREKAAMLSIHKFSKRSSRSIIYRFNITLQQRKLFCKATINSQIWWHQVFMT